jgi:hypothetical protein
MRLTSGQLFLYTSNNIPEGGVVPAAELSHSTLSVVSARESVLSSWLYHLLDVVVRHDGEP